MKQILIIISILFSLSSCKNDQKIYLSQDYKTAFKLAPKTGKKIFIDFYTTWCGGCKGFDRYIFPDSSFQAFLQEYFYSLKLDGELPENKEIVKKYKITGYPTIIIADSRGNEINRIVGFKDLKSDYYIKLIKNIVTGKESFEAYKNNFLNHPDSVELAKDIEDKLIANDDYKNLRVFTELVNNNSKNQDIIFEANYYNALADLWDKSIESPKALKDILYMNNILSSKYEERILSVLSGFYQDIPDSFEYYGTKLLRKFPDSLGDNRQFAEYLFLHNRNIELARKYAVYYDSAFNIDHWAAYLTALSDANQDDIEGGARYFDNWIKKNESSFDNDWPFFFYVRYATIYKIRIDKAIEYAYRVENGSCDKTEIRINLAKLLHEKGENIKAINKLNEIIPLINSSKEKQEIDKLIKEYSI